MKNGLSDPAIKHLRLRWGFFGFFGIVLLAAGYPVALQIWPAPYPFRWLFFSALTMAYLLFSTYQSLSLNHRPDETHLLPTFGVGNSLSLGRGLVIALVAGFLFSPRPEGGAAWLPGLLYVAGALPDGLDGYFARKQNHVTRLGEALDMNVDSIGVFVATLLAVLYGTVPWWYLPIGLGRYLFLIGIWIREKRGLPIFDLPYSVRRRTLAAFMMGYMFAMLFPLFGPPGTHVAAAAFGLPFAASFIWDFLIVSGEIPPDEGARRPALKGFLLHWVPVIFRLAVIFLITPQIISHITGDQLLLGLTEILVVGMITIGFIGRIFSVVALLLMGSAQNLAPLLLPQFALIVILVFLLLLGTGKYSVLPFEDHLVYGRTGVSEG